jgi:hypothetical protein
MAITNFIPELWAASLLELWTAENIFANLLDRSYEGLASKGNTVHIPGVVAPAVKDYKANGRTTSADAITDTGVDLLIDQEKNFDFYVDDIDRVQANGSLEVYTMAAAEALVADSDRFIATKLVQDGDVLPWVSGMDTGDEAYTIFRDARKKMNKANVPSAGRVAVINAELEGLLLGADSRLTSYDTAGDTNGMRNATVGKLLDFRVITSNHLPESDSPQGVFFHPSAAAYVSQIDEVEALRADNKFADRVRGLHVYGGKVVRPTGVVVYNELGT